MTFLSALKGENKGKPPVWFMRQAGRYLPDYRAIRTKYSFMEMIHTPSIATDVTLLPLNYFDPDALILFSDILVILEAFSIRYDFIEGIGPKIDTPITTALQVEALKTIPPEESLGFVFDAIKNLKKDITKPLIGFSGAPFTVASYLIEGGSSSEFKKIKKWMFENPESFHQLLDKICDATILYLKKQIESGVDAIQVFDSWAHVLAFPQFKEFSLHYLKRICDEVKGVPIILFSRGSSVFASELAKLSPQALSLDWNASLSDLRKILPSHVGLQGNLDPDVLYAPPKVVETEVKRLLDSMKGDPRYIFNLGHGIKPDVPFETVRRVVDLVKG